jgi:hypothetical protein
VRRLSRWQVASLGLGIAVLGVGLGVWQARRLDFLEHELLYRQTTTRMETLGELYTGIHVLDPNAPFKPGTAVATIEPGSGWLRTGLVRQPGPDGLVTVDFTDGSTRNVAPDQLVLLQSAPIPPLELFEWIGPNLVSFVTGLSTTDETPNWVWVPAALLWDVLLLVALVGLLRSRPPLHDLLYPACVVVGTVVVLLGVPGAPGNADRHRATQTVPLLAVLAAGVVSSRPRTMRASRSAVALSGATSSPASAETPAISRSRLAR